MDDKWEKLITTGDKWFGMDAAQIPAARTPHQNEQSSTVATLPNSNPVVIEYTCDICQDAGWLLVDKQGGQYGNKDLVRCECGEAADAERARLLARAKMQAVTGRLQSELGRLASCTFDNFDGTRPLPVLKWEGQEVSEAVQRRALRKALDTCKQYAEVPEGWLYLHGAYGAGKSHLAAAIANKRITTGDDVYYRSVPGMLDDIRKGFKDHSSDQIFEALLKVDLLILDDIGAEHMKDWAEERLFVLLNERQGRPMVLTSNLHPDELPARLASRIAGNATAIWMPVSDYRRLRGTR